MQGKKELSKLAHKICPNNETAKAMWVRIPPWAPFLKTHTANIKFKTQCHRFDSDFFRLIGRIAQMVEHKHALSVLFIIVGQCNGNTRDFDSLFKGSNPLPTAMLGEWGIITEFNINILDC